MIRSLHSTALRRFAAALVLGMLAAVPAGCGSDDTKAGDRCMPDDVDGVNGGQVVFQITVNDTEFSHKILTAQNLSHVKLTLTNAGTTPHGFSIDCLPTPNSEGCPAESCFPTETKIASVDPGASASVEFDVPNPEGIYPFRSPVTGDAQTGQFIIQ
jgi:hypothetical protein